MLIVNDPLNVRIVKTPSLQTTSVDIELLKAIPGVTCCTSNVGTSGILVFNSGVVTFDFTESFSFAPADGFVQVTSVQMTVLYTYFSSFNQGDAFNVLVNGQSTGSVPARQLNQGVAITAVATLQVQPLRVGSNVIEIAVFQGGPNTAWYFFYEVRLTIEYTFMA